MQLSQHEWFVTAATQIDTMLGESGTREGFDAAQWLANWLQLPLPALGGRVAVEYLDKDEGQKLVSQLLAATRSGVYL